MRINTYKIYTLGCKVNQHDSLSLSKKLDLAGLVTDKKNCDLAIINTCAVTKTAILKCKRTINKAKKENQGAKIILTGCWVRVDKRMDVGVDVICARDKVVKEIRKIGNLGLGIRNKRKKLIPNTKSRYFIKIQDGCEQFCTYCIIPYARGKLKSRGEAELLKEIRQVVKEGIREVVLCGIHLGKFRFITAVGGIPPSKKVSGGKNEDLRMSLCKLIKNILKIKSLGRIRLSSIEVNEVNDELIELIKKGVEKHKKDGGAYVCRHLHLPLQSGTDKILKLMNRPYDKNKFKSKIRKIRKIIPNITITTDIIVGFPGETKKDFLETYNFAKEMKFSKIHVFPFSAHKKTLAFNFPDQISRIEKQARAKKLRSLSEKLEKEFKNKFRSKETEVVVENIKNGKIKGISEFYFDVELENKEYKTGEIIKQKL